MDGCIYKTENFWKYKKYKTEYLLSEDITEKVNF